MLMRVQICKLIGLCLRSSRHVGIVSFPDSGKAAFGLQQLGHVGTYVFPEFPSHRDRRSCYFESALPSNASFASLIADIAVGHPE